MSAQSIAPVSAHGISARFAEPARRSDAAGSHGLSTAGTQREVNERLLTPSGKLPDVEGLESDLHGVLAMAHSPTSFNSRELDKLVAEYGADFCAFWASWLLRKIAAEYEAGRPVESPAGLYTQAVRGHWEVDPKWPEYDEVRHTATEDDYLRYRSNAHSEMNRTFPGRSELPLQTG